MRKKPFPFMLVAVLLLIGILSLCILTSHPSDGDQNKKQKFDFFHLRKKPKTSDTSNKADAVEIALKGLSKDSIKFTDVQGTVKYFVDTSQSILNWKSGLHTGYVKFYAGVFYMENSEIKSGEFYMDMVSIVDTDIEYQLMKETLENVLKSRDWFSSNEYPLSVFKITDASYSSSDSVQITGSLNLMSRSHEVIFNSAFQYAKDSIATLSESFLIDRTHWNILTMSERHVTDDKSFIVPDNMEIQIEIIAKQ